MTDDPKSLPEHGIDELTARRVGVDSFHVSLRCRCDASYEIPCAEITGVLDAALQMFFTHLAMVR